RLGGASLRRITQDAVVTEWLPATGDDHGMPNPVRLPHWPLNYVGALATMTLLPPLQQSRAPRTRRASAVPWRYRVRPPRRQAVRDPVTTDDHALPASQFYLATAIPGRERRDAEKAHRPRRGPRGRRAGALRVTRSPGLLPGPKRLPAARGRGGALAH